MNPWPQTAALPKLPVAPGAGALQVAVGLPSVQKAVLDAGGTATGLLCPAARWASAAAEVRNVKEDFMADIL